MKQLAVRRESGEGALSSYVIGFVLSILLTSIAYWTVTNQLLTGSALTGVLVFLALVQLIVQLVFFMHLDRLKSRWKLFVFLGMFLIVCILVFGTIWIMANLKYRMTGGSVDAYMSSQDAF